MLHIGGGQTRKSEAAPNCSVSNPASCVETFSPTLQVGNYVLEVYEWTNTQEVDDPDPEHRPIGRTCFDVTVTQ